MMTATLRPLGMLKSYTADQPEVSIRSGIPVRQALLDLVINPDLVAGVFVNGEQQNKDYILQDGDVVKLLAVIGGG